MIDMKNVNDSYVLEDAFKMAKKNNIEPVIHLPFLDTEENEIKLSWLVVPESYKGQLKAKEQSLDNLVKCLDISSKYDVKYATFHVTSSKNTLNEREFKIFESKLSDLVAEADKRGIKISVETGGVTENQLVYLSNKYNTAITLDLAHAHLDGIDYVDFYKKHKDKIKTVHLSQTSEGKDEHRHIYEAGVIDVDSILTEVAKDYSKGDVKFVILETFPDIKNQYHLAKFLPKDLNADIERLI